MPLAEEVRYCDYRALFTLVALLHFGAAFLSPSTMPVGRSGETTPHCGSPEQSHFLYFGTWTSNLVEIITSFSRTSQLDSGSSVFSPCSEQILSASGTSTVFSILGK